MVEDALCSVELKLHNRPLLAKTIVPFTAMVNLLLRNLLQPYAPQQYENRGIGAMQFGHGPIFHDLNVVLDAKR